MRYVDTSLLMAALTPEISSEAARAWLAEHSPDGIVVSDWVITEFSAALSLKVRTGQLGQPDREIAQLAFGRLLMDAFIVLRVDRRAFRIAAGFADRPDVALRAGDALHLALASKHDLSLYTLDRRQAADAVLVDVDAELVGEIT